MIEIQLPTFHVGQAQAYQLKNPETGKNARYKAIRCGRRWGKQLWIETPIPTPRGWASMGTLKPGDIVFDDRGHQCRIIAATEVRYGCPTNEVRFNDGTIIIADDDHEWLTWDKAARKSRDRGGKIKPTTRTTKQIRETLLTSQGETNHSIKSCKPVQCLPVNLPIPPYALGVWLSDGDSDSPAITKHKVDMEVIERIEGCGDMKVRYLYDQPNGSSRWHLGDYGELKPILRSLNLIKNKHIPAVYLRSSIEQRSELLNGLMDCDGYISEQGHCEFCSMSKELAFGVLELCRSLGIRASLYLGRATLNGVDHGEKYRVKFTTNARVFSLRRKLDRLRTRSMRGSDQLSHRFIVDIRPIESLPMRCIAVDSPSHLYLASEAFIPTHNTQILSAITVDRAVKRKIVGWFTPETKFRQEPYGDIARMLAPVMKRSSKTEGVMHTMTGGQIDFWSLENEMAGRGRHYHTVIIDEAAFTNPNMLDIWKQNIEPTLLDYQGEAFVASNTNGVDPENFFYAICNDPTLRFVQHHAPTTQNPHIPVRVAGESEIEFQLRRKQIFDDLIANTQPLVYQQEYLAEFVDWSGESFFDREKLLVNGEPVPFPQHCDAVYAVIDTATKTGKEHDGTAVVYCALLPGHLPAQLIWLDWELRQIEGDLLEAWLPTVFARLEELARLCGARFGVAGIHIEDKASGSVLIMASQRRGWNVLAIDSKLTSLGKSERAISVSGYVYQGKVKISREAYDKQMVYKGTARNHLMSQVTGFRIGVRDTALTQDDMLDAGVYSIAIGLGDSQGI